MEKERRPPFLFFLPQNLKKLVVFFKVRKEAPIKFKFRQGITVAENCSGCVAD